MVTIAQTLFATAPIGVPVALPAAGTSLENPYVYDATARELKARAASGSIEIVDERIATTGEDADELICHLQFVRRR